MEISSPVTLDGVNFQPISGHSSGYRNLPFATDTFPCDKVASKLFSPSFVFGDLRRCMRARVGGWGSGQIWATETESSSRPDR